MDETKSIRIPMIEGLESLPDSAFVSTLKKSGAPFTVDCVNWSETFPDKPTCKGWIAMGKDSIAVHFKSDGPDLRIQNLSDNLRQWEDSCVEFFVQDPESGYYYNFEVNPAGKILAAYGAAREGRTQRPAAQMDTIRRIAPTVPGPIELKGGSHAWEVTFAIPLKLIGVDPANPPKSLRANFYKCGDKTGTPHYLSWNPVGTQKPDFHRPEYFGTLLLGDSPKEKAAKGTIPAKRAKSKCDVRRNWIFRILLVLWAAAVAYLCFGHFDKIPNVPRVLFGYPIDKVIHFAMFLPFPILSYFSFDTLSRKPFHALLFAVCLFLAGCVIAGLTEIGQMKLTSYRSGDFMDFKADAIALAISSLLVTIIDLGKQFAKPRES